MTPKKMTVSFSARRMHNSKLPPVSRYCSCSKGINKAECAPPFLVQPQSSFSDVRSPPLEGLDNHAERFQVRRGLEVVYVAWGFRVGSAGHSMAVASLGELLRLQVPW